MHGLATICSHCKLRQGIMSYRADGGTDAIAYICGPCSEREPVCVHCQRLVGSLAFEVRYHGRAGYLCRACALPTAAPPA